MRINKLINVNFLGGKFVTSLTIHTPTRSLGPRGSCELPRTNLCPIGSAVLIFIGYKQANKKSIQFSNYLILSIKQFRWFFKGSIRLPFKKKFKISCIVKNGITKKYCIVCKITLITLFLLTLYKLFNL